VPVRGSTVPWQQRLATIVSYPNRKKGEAFLSGLVEPALEEVARELKETKVDAVTAHDDRCVSLNVTP